MSVILKLAAEGETPQPFPDGLVPRILQDVTWQFVVVSDGTAQADGGATLVLQWDFVRFEDRAALARFIGIHPYSDQPILTIETAGWDGLPYRLTGRAEYRAGTRDEQNQLMRNAQLAFAALQLVTGY